MVYASAGQPEAQAGRAQWLQAMERLMTPTSGSA